MVDQPVVKVLTTQVSVTSCGLDLENALLDGQQRHIEGATTKVKDQNIALADGCVLLIETVSDGCSSWLVDDTHALQASDDC